MKNSLLRGLHVGASLLAMLSIVVPIVHGASMHVTPYTLLQNTSDVVLQVGATHQRIGSFYVTPKDCDYMRIYAVNTVLNTIKGVKNLELYIAGEQSGSTFKDPNSNHNKFVVSGKVLEKGKQVQLDVYADITTEFNEAYLFVQVPANGVFVEIEGTCIVTGTTGGTDTTVVLGGDNAETTQPVVTGNGGQTLVVEDDRVEILDEPTVVAGTVAGTGNTNNDGSGTTTPESQEIIFGTIPSGGSPLVSSAGSGMTNGTGNQANDGTGSGSSVGNATGTTTGNEQNPFSDIGGHWAYPYIMDLYQQGVLEGYDDGTFRPNQPLNRAELSKITATVFPGAIKKDAQEFPDVAEGVWFFPTIQELSRANVIHGYGDGYFRPERLVSRAEAMKIFILGAGADRAVVEANYSFYNPFLDFTVSDWFYPYVTRALYEGVVAGKTATSFDPNGLVTRAEAAKMLSLLRALSPTMN